MASRILILGGTGHFGRRIARTLAASDEIEVIVASRNAAHASAVASELGSRTSACAIDHTSPNLVSQLRATRPHIVIHTAGPFQGQDYRVARAALDVGAHYLDLADATDFVEGFAAELTPLAEASQRCAITGASSLPALSSAVVDALHACFDQLTEIQIAISTAQRSRFGTATAAAVLSYCGKPFVWLQDGRWQTVMGWRSVRRLQFAELGNRLGGACNVPDLKLFPERYPNVRTVQFRAAPELSSFALALALLSALGSIGFRFNLDKRAQVFRRLTHFFDVFGSNRGGMLISLTGSRGGAPSKIEWHLTVGDNHGPEIPCIASILLAKKLANGFTMHPAALPCVGMLSLSEFERAFAAWSIRTQVIEYH